MKSVPLGSQNTIKFTASFPFSQHSRSSCDISGLEAFALGLQKEFPAFQAAYSLPYNNRMTEGFVNKLKYIKRSIYGRGNFELLRQQVLQSAV